jgi:CBS domain-containing protein
MMRNEILRASMVHFQSHIQKHRVNVEVMLRNPTALPEHTDIMDAIEKELAIIAEYEDKLEALKYFPIFDGKNHD